MPNNERRLSARDAVGNIDRYSVRTVSIFVQVAPTNATGRNSDADVVRPEYHPRTRLQFDGARALRLGIPQPPDLKEIVRQYLEDFGKR